jgi:OOP family OmpA-OmpF porin
MKRWAVAATLILLCGCSTYSLEKLRKAEPSGNAFQKALAREYMDYAAELERDYDWPESWHFADKGLSAVYGKDIGPDNVEDRDIPADKAVELAKAREDLITTLNPYTLESQPELSARAFKSFDCWLKNQEDGWQYGKIAECKNDYESAMEALKGAGNQAVGGPSTSAYIVFFEWNKASLNAQGYKVINAAMKEVEGLTNYEIVLNGHTDTTGLEKFNLTLSKRRADTVKAALIERGAKPGAIKIFAFGESDPRVPTPDNTDEPQNRRVEIFIQ